MIDYTKDIKEVWLHPKRGFMVCDTVEEARNAKDDNYWFLSYVRGNGEEYIRGCLKKGLENDYFILGNEWLLKYVKTNHPEMLL